MGEIIETGRGGKRGGKDEPPKKPKMSTDALTTEILRFEKDGRIDTEEIVEAARAKSHPLHGEFEWRDRIAAHKYRLGQAAALVRRVLEPADEDGDEPLLVRSFISRPEDRVSDPHIFVRRRLALDEQISRLDTLIDTLTKARGMMTNLGARELQPVLSTLDPVLAALMRQRSIASVREMPGAA